MHKFKPEKSKYFGEPAKNWWNTISIEDKKMYKLHYEKVREWNSKRKIGQYPNMYDTTHLRISQLSEKQIYRIYVFKTHPVDKERY